MTPFEFSLESIRPNPRISLKFEWKTTTPRCQARKITMYTKNILRYKQEYKCAKCFILLPPNHDIDHIVPVHKGGTDCITNLQALCKNCHGWKTYKEEETRILSRQSNFKIMPVSPILQRWKMLAEKKKKKKEALLPCSAPFVGREE